VARASVGGSATGGFVAEDSGLHAASRMTIRLMTVLSHVEGVRRDRFFSIILLISYSTKSLRKDYRRALRLQEVPLILQ